MTESSTNSAANLWSVPECPFQIATSARVLDDIRLTVVDAFFSLPRGGAEIGGILLGSYEAGRLTINNYAALDCEHAYGPSFALSPPDEDRLKTLIAAHASGAAGVRPVGWYHSHTRSEIFLSDADLVIHKRYFPEAWQVAMVIKPHTFEPARIGYFFREADGSMRTKNSYREITLDALPIRQVPNGMPSVAPADQPPLRRWRPEATAGDLESAAQAAPVAVPAAEVSQAETKPEAEVATKPVAELTAPLFLPPEPSAWTRGWVWVVAIGVGLGIGSAGFQTRQAWLPRVVAVVNPAPSAPARPPTLGLSIIDREGQLQINWDRNSRGLLHASDAILEITDAAPTPQAIQLDGAHLRTGSFTYARQAEKVDVKLIVHRAGGPDLAEVASFLGKLPERKPREDAEAAKQRDELAKQAAKLKTDLGLQAAKTKKLERDLQSMRDEMKQQQLKRLNNQLTDK